jgi:hypothetical protein
MAGRGRNGVMGGFTAAGLGVAVPGRMAEE